MFVSALTISKLTTDREGLALSRTGESEGAEHSEKTHMYSLTEVLGSVLVLTRVRTAGVMRMSC